MTPQLMALLTGTTGVGFLMLLAGLQKNTLELRRHRRECPSCGRLIEARVCGNCAG